jgi:ferrochelatase
MKSVILVNVGTPQSPTPEDVGVYLREFLMDENILPIPRPFRDLLVKGLIVPRRKYSSAEKYHKIWTEQGSPLMVESEKLRKSLQQELGPSWSVHLGMQVGLPSLKDTLQQRWKDSEEIHVVPLYPQFATATTGGVLSVLKSQGSTHPAVRMLKPFYQESWFIQAQAERIRARLRPEDHLLLSYHGLPVSQLRSHRAACRSDASCCELPSACAENCYKAQCLQTNRLLQKELGLSADKMHIGFQSRLGRSRWIEPSTTQTMKNLVQNGVQSLKVACPSFVADCLETLEEIGQELKHEFHQVGGGSFELIECLNNHEGFVRGLARNLKSV